MKRALKKSVAFMLFLAMTFQLIVNTPALGINAETADPEVIATEDVTSVFQMDEGYIYGYTGTDKDVVIPSDLGITSVSFNNYETEDPSYEVIESLTVPEGVTYLSLVCLHNLKKLVLPSTIEYLDLYDCPVTSVDISKAEELSSLYLEDLPELTSIKSDKISGYYYVYSCPKLKTVDFSNGELKYLCVNNCESLETISIGSADSIAYIELPSIKSANVPSDATSIYLIGVDYDKVTIEDNKAGYSIKDGGLYYENESYGETHKYLAAIDTTKKVINVAEGTYAVYNLSLSGNCYVTETINLPESLEEIGYGAFYGGKSIKNLTIPKNVITIGGYAFSGIQADIAIPKSVQYLDDDTFADYSGKISIEENTEYIEVYDDGIYNHHFSYDGEPVYTSLVYYPSDKTSISWLNGTDYIGSAVFMNTVMKKLNIPEGVRYLDLKLSNARNLTSVTIPSSIYYIDREFLSDAPALKKVSVSPNNKYYASYKNCIYDKDMTTLWCVPSRLEKIVIPEGVVSLGYYLIAKHYVDDPSTEDGYYYVEPVVTIPRSASEVPDYYIPIDFKKAYVYADTELAEYMRSINEYYMEDALEYDYEPYLYNYEFRDSNKDLLTSIYVIDKITVKKGKTATVVPELPGMNFVSELTKNNNTECMVKFSSSNKKIAKVDPATGEITGVKKGTCTVNVKFTITNGTKKSSKTLKVKVKVK